MVSSDGLSRSYPDHAWFGGKVASWENRKDGFVWLFEVISDPQSFKEVVNSLGNPELIKLYNPQPGQVLNLTFLDGDNQPLNREPVALDAYNPSVELQRGDRFIMDATSTTTLGYLAYTCFCKGITEL